MQHHFVLDKKGFQINNIWKPFFVDLIIISNIKFSKK